MLGEVEACWSGPSLSARKTAFLPPPESSGTWPRGPFEAAEDEPMGNCWAGLGLTGMRREVLRV